MEKKYGKIIGFIACFILILSGALLFVYFKNNNINIIDDKLELVYGVAHKINVDVRKNDIELEWESSNPELVIVEDGNILFVSNESGSATITVESKNGFRDTIVIETIKNEEVIPVTGIDLSDFDNITVDNNESFSLNASVYPNDATNQGILYTSSDPESVKINNDGVITVLNNKVDTVTITATSIDGNFSSSINVNVGASKNVDSNDIKDNVESNTTINVKPLKSLSFTKNEITLNTGDYFSLESLLKLEPKNANLYNLTWSFGVTNKMAPVIDVDKSTGVVRAIRGGTSTVTVKYKNISASIRVNVKNHNKLIGSFLKASGTNIVKVVDGKEMPVILKGINLGAWLSRSYSMSSFVPLVKEDIQANKYGDNSCINNISFYGALMSERKGGRLTETQAIELSNILYNNFVNEEDFDIIAQMGANVVRLPIEYSFFSKYKTKKEALDYIENVVKIANERGIYVIIDLHLVKGRQNDGGYCGKGTFFEKDEKTNTYPNIDDTVKLWADIAYRFKDNIGVAGYELLNEPEGNIGPLVYYYNEAYKTIRKYDKNHIVIMDENCVVCGYKGASQYRDENGLTNNIGNLPDPNLLPKNMTNEEKTLYWGKDRVWYNVVYSTHDYTYKSSSQTEDKHDGKNIYLLLDRLKDKLENVKLKSNTYAVPYYVGEFSFYGTSVFRNNNSNAYKEYLQVWNAAMDLYERYGFSYSPWTYKANNELYYGLVFYGSGNKINPSNKIKADLINDSYETLKNKFSYKSYENMKFNEDYYFMLLEQFKSKRIVTSIKASKTNFEMKVGDSTYIDVTVTPVTAINKKLNWISSSDDVVKVDYETGRLEAVGKGTATITISNNPFDKYIDSTDVFKCSGKLASNIEDVSINNFNCVKYTIDDSNSKVVSTIIKIIVK